MSIDVLDWVLETQQPRVCTMDEFMYDHMDSQSGRSLPILYEPFDVQNPGHWGDRGWLLDFLATAGRGKVLDFGPGDGWPSLIMAPFCEQIVGVDGSRRRVEVCRENAVRLGISNAEFIYVAPGDKLPFDDGSFDGITAASSLEQTPDPYATLQELYRVLRPKGKIRLSYEALSRYRDKDRRGGWLFSLGDNRSRVMLNENRIDQERAIHCGLDLDLSYQEALDLLAGGEEDSFYENLTVAALERAQEHIHETLICTLQHPSCRTLFSWMDEIGFHEHKTTYSGGWYAWTVCQQLEEAWRPTDLDALDLYLRPLIEAFVQFAAPVEADQPITATK